MSRLGFEHQPSACEANALGDCATTAARALILNMSSFSDNSFLRESTFLPYALTVKFGLFL